MADTRALLWCALVACARAQGAQGLSTDLDPTMTVLSVRLDSSGLPVTGSGAERASSVLTSVYWLRALEERVQGRTRYGLHVMDHASWQPFLQQEATAARRPMMLFQDQLFPGGTPFAAVRFERRDVLFEGDQLSIRSVSDVQTLARGIGLTGTGGEAALLSLLGWQSRSKMVWQLGDPAREFQWSFSADIDRRARAQRGTVGLQLLRRF